METIRVPSIRPQLGVRANKAAPVIVATDGHAQSDAALVIGRAIAGSPDALRVATVIPAVPVIPESVVVASEEFLLARRAEAQRAVIGQMTRTWDQLHDVEILHGDPAAVLARMAHDTSATMIVCGIGKHRIADRLFSDETALRLVRLSDVPVLAAADGYTNAPQRVVVACDFSETSLRAARMSIELAADNATLYLVHVVPRDGPRFEYDGWGSAYKQEAIGALQQTKEQLRFPADMVVHTAILQGDAATELLAFSGSVNAELIATGSHGSGFIARMLLGSVATRILRMSTRSVLTVPHAAVMTPDRVGTVPIGERVARDDWASTLDEFSRRNRGRRTTLEVDDVELGAQAQHFDYPFQGATYDHNDHRVTIMFGDDEGAGHHVTRGIAGARTINLLRSNTGRDLALRVAHGKGQTLLTFIT